MTPMKWNAESIESDIRSAIGSTGIFPSANDLRKIGRNDLACAINKNGGFLYWSDKLGVPRRESDSDFGWAGEVAFIQLAAQHGFSSQRQKQVKSPYDILLDGVLRIDVKTARRMTYQHSTGWFYRIAKQPQADVIALYQFDTNDFYGLPWWACPTSNVTISRDGGKYAQFKNNWPWLRHMVFARKTERIGMTMAAVA